MIQQIFLELTNVCTGRCITCLNRVMQRPRGIMPRELYNRLIQEIRSVGTTQAHLYGVGESYTVPDHMDRFRFAIDNLTKSGIAASIITNGNVVTEIPEGIHAFDISFNAGKPETYEKITGLDFDRTYSNLQRLQKSGEFRKAAKSEIHMLVFERNKDELTDFAHLFAGWDVTLRYGFKYDNQHGLVLDETLPEFRDAQRLPCHYVLNCLNIYWDGRVVICPHDFEGEVIYGDLDKQSILEIMSSPLRQQKIREHLTGIYKGICENCNYNVEFEGKYFAIRGKELTSDSKLWLEGKTLRWAR